MFILPLLLLPLLLLLVLMHHPRYDPGVLISAIARYFPSLLSSGPDALKLTGPFSKVGTHLGSVRGGVGGCEFVGVLKVIRGCGAQSCGRPHGHELQVC
jgi:hypothetical protein